MHQPKPSTVTGPVPPPARHEATPGLLSFRVRALRASVDAFGRLPAVVQLNQAPVMLALLVDVIEAIAERIEGQNHA